MLELAFQPSAIEVLDDSARHAGHAGAGLQGETHFNVAMVSSLFTGLSRVERSRLVHQALGAEFEGGLHALSLVLRSPSEISSQTAITRA